MLVIEHIADGLRAYVDAIYRVFGNEVDYAILRKIYGVDRSGATAAGAGARYSPPECIGCEQELVCGWPEQAHVSTHAVERANLTMRMGMRRFTRLTNGHSKKIENHKHMLAIFFTYYNFCRIHSTTKVTPAMGSGLTTRLWEIEDVVGLMG